ncbi:hypothetical protein TWF569_003162 [Orbilia oligospora]|uniref:Uncharacterized protein n=1 Tax=Orbilia oligospora TaxID=2813651 RepID=A0A7C8J7Y4_ORBOL|nr:hypothetical protein TWF706_003396 [Orbilia oligospora]KAF3084181.1 hypothetical protein TWF102_000427 [Orbilia oligospora]KAF3113737.1 hypothetical protein TWF103_002083 [Orbilia oligospora]KAF3120426.1 hypothetical protein TWF569_003162 [Orbilia oligospora]KAF3153009.1 hypothetical protein TWF594_000056 [Orbilia oligospora]
MISPSHAQCLSAGRSLSDRNFVRRPYLCDYLARGRTRATLDPILRKTLNVIGPTARKKLFPPVQLEVFLLQPDTYICNESSLEAKIWNA